MENFADKYYLASNGQSDQLDELIDFVNNKFNNSNEHRAFAIVLCMNPNLSQAQQFKLSEKFGKYIKQNPAYSISMLSNPNEKLSESVNKENCVLYDEEYYDVKDYLEISDLDILRKKLLHGLTYSNDKIEAIEACEILIDKYSGSIDNSHYFKLIIDRIFNLGCDYYYDDQLKYFFDKRIKQINLSFFILLNNKYSFYNKEDNSAEYKFIYFDVLNRLYNVNINKKECLRLVFENFDIKFGLLMFSEYSKNSEEAKKMFDGNLYSYYISLMEASCIFNEHT